MNLRVFAYQRFSTDLQDERSIEDQQRECEDLAERLAPGAVVRHFSDKALSGASMIGRSGLQTMLRRIRAGEADLLVAEDTDRLSRSLADLASMHDQLRFAGVRLVTVGQGEIDETKVAFMGLMAQQFLKNLAQKTHRGLRGQIERGQSAGGRSYGYRVENVGVFVIVPEEAEVIRRVMREFAAGLSPENIAKRLNGERTPGPTGAPWGPSTIYGNWRRGTGLLNNELYVGRRIWNRQRFLKDPRTGKRVARMNPSSAWVTKNVPELRIIDDDLWNAVKVRQTSARRLAKEGGPVRARRPKHLFTGVTRCAECGGGFTISSRDQLTCFNAGSRGTCKNTRRISRQELETRVLRALRERFLADPEHFKAFSVAFIEELNQRRKEHRAHVEEAPRELARINRRSKEIMELLLAGFRDEAWKIELSQIEARRSELEARIAAAETEPVLPVLHPYVATAYRERIEDLAAALKSEDIEQREAARETLRGFVPAIAIPAGNALLQVRGDLGRMLAAAASSLNNPALRAVAQAGCGGGI